MNENMGPKPAQSPSPFADLPVPKPFTASAREIAVAIIMYIAAYLYIDRAMFINPFYEQDETVWLVVFTVLLVAMTETLHWNTRRSRESWVWLGCVAVIEAAILLRRSSVWNAAQSSLFVHLGFIWWVLSRSGVLLERETGRMLPADVISGCLIYPFQHFFLRVRCLYYGLRQLRSGKRRVKAATVGWSVLAIVLAAVFFVTAVNLLSGADVHFQQSMARFLKLFKFQSDGFDRFLETFLFSLPVAAWLFGLIAGTGRLKREDLDARAKSVDGFVVSLKKVPTAVWIALTAAFCALYAVFFVLHTPYLLGAFSRNLPTGYTVSRYARQGFFELCKVMAVNFALLWLVTRMSRVSVWENKGLKAVSLLLLAESLLFAVIAGSKLWLYIDCFGFTPLRLQSAWLICSLAFGCACAIWSILRKQKTIRIWVIFSAVTLSLLHFV